MLVVPLLNILTQNAKHLQVPVESVFKEKSLNNKGPKINSNKQIIGNYYLGEDNWILGKFSKLLPDNKIKQYSNVINELAESSTKVGKDVYFISMTHKTNMLKHLYPKFVDNKENIDINKNAFKANLNLNNTKFIDIDKYFLNIFSEKELEKFYFKTDHHWNGLGAFEGFKFMVKDIDLAGLSHKELDEHFSKYKTLINKEKFLKGSYNSKLGFPIKERDYASYVYLKNANYEYFISDTKKDTKIKEDKIIASLRNKDSWDYGGAYMRGTHCNILKIKNKKALTNKKALVFRDSYQAPMTLLLADVFSQVEIIDPRYIENIDLTYDQIIRNSDSDIVLFMYNSFGFGDMIKEMIDKGIK